MKQGEGKLVLEVSCFLLWLLKPDGSIRDLIMSEFPKGGVLEAEQLYRGKTKILSFLTSVRRLFQALLVQRLSQRVIEGRRH